MKDWRTSPDGLQAEINALKRLQAETAADLEAAMEQFSTIAEELKK